MHAAAYRNSADLTDLIDVTNALVRPLPSGREPLPGEIKRFIRECEFLLHEYPAHVHSSLLSFFEAKLSNEAHVVISTLDDLNFKALKDRLLRKFVPRQTLQSFYDNLVKCKQMPEEPLRLYLDRIDALHRGFIAFLKAKHDQLCTKALESEIDELTSRQLTYGVKCQNLSIALSTIVIGGFEKKFEFAEDYELCSPLVREQAEFTGTQGGVLIDERVEKSVMESELRPSGFESRLSPVGTPRTSHECSTISSDLSSLRTVTRAVKSKRRNTAYLLTRRKCYKCGLNGHISTQCRGLQKDIND